MTTSTYMAALAALDEAPREEVSQVFISPLGDQSTEVDAETETAAFVSRPDPMRESETRGRLRERAKSYAKALANDILR